MSIGWGILWPQPQLYNHIYHHLLVSEIDYKPRIFSQFQIKKVHRKIPSYGQLFYVECPKNGMLITALVHAEMRNKSIRQNKYSTANGFTAAHYKQ